MPLTFVNHLAQASAETTIGRNKQTVAKLSLVFHLKGYMMPRNYYMYLLAATQKTPSSNNYTVKLTVISLLENKRKEITTGASNLQIRSLVIVKRKFSMERRWRCRWRGMKRDFHRLRLCRKLLRIILQLQMINWDVQRIQDKDKMIEDPTSYMESKI